MNNAKAFHAPLHVLDTEKQTHGCRHINPDICSKCCTPKTCAFTLGDNICLSPPASWPKQYKKLRESKAKVK